MPDYKQGKIYKMTCETGKVYIGSTVKPLKKRLCIHKGKYNVCETKDFINPKIELIESYPCETKQQLLWRERELIEKNECVNKLRPIITDEEKHINKKKSRTAWDNRNKEMLKDKKSHWYQENKERINQKFKCECGSNFIYRNKVQHLKTKKHQAFVSSVKTNL